MCSGCPRWWSALSRRGQNNSALVFACVHPLVLASPHASAARRAGVSLAFQAMTDDGTNCSVVGTRLRCACRSSAAPARRRGKATLTVCLESLQAPNSGGAGGEKERKGHCHPRSKKRYRGKAGAKAVPGSVQAPKGDERGRIVFTDLPKSAVRARKRELLPAAKNIRACCRLTGSVHAAILSA